jgi:hypothetical protein
MSLLALHGVLQDDQTSIVVDDAPLLDLLDGSKTAETGKVIVQAAISNAGRLHGAGDVTHLRQARFHGPVFQHTRGAKSRQFITTTGYGNED